MPETPTANDRFEALAHEFFMATGMLAPGKDVAAAEGSAGGLIEERIEAWDAWIAKRRALTPSETAGPPMPIGTTAYPICGEAVPVLKGESPR